MADQLGTAEIESLSLDELHAKLAGGAEFSVTDAATAEPDASPAPAARGAGAADETGAATTGEGGREGETPASSAPETPQTPEERIALLERQAESYKGNLENQRKQYQAQQAALQAELARLQEAEAQRVQTERQQVQAWINSLPDEAQRRAAQTEFDRSQFEQQKQAWDTQRQQYEQVARAREMEAARREVGPYFGQYADYVASQLSLDPADVRDIIETPAFMNAAAAFEGPQDLVKIGAMIEAHALAVQQAQSRQREANRAAAKAAGTHADVGQSGTAGSPTWVDIMNNMDDAEFLKFQEQTRNNGGKFPKR